MNTPTLDSGRHPFELFVLVFGLVSGLPQLWGAPSPGTTTALLGHAYVKAWAIMFAGGCAVALVGVVIASPTWRDHVQVRARPTTGLLVESVGLVALCASTLVYVVGLVEATALPGRLVTASLFVSLAVASAWRVWQIHSFVRAVILDQVE